MNTYEVTLLVDASKYLQVVANSPEEAAEVADEKAGHVCLCHQCSDEIETGDTYGAHVYLAGKQVLDTTRAGSLEVQNAALKEENARLMRLHADTCVRAGDEIAALKARIAELEEELGGWVKSFDDVNARCIALSERYES